MKTLIPLILVGIAGWFVYENRHSLTDVPEGEPPADLAPSTTGAAPVDFAVKSMVRRLFEEWQRRSLAGAKGEHGSARTDMAKGLMDIRRKLFSLGVYSEKAVAETMQRALEEIGVEPEECREVVEGILALAEVDQQTAASRKQGASSGGGMPWSRSGPGAGN